MSYQENCSSSKDDTCEVSESQGYKIRENVKVISSQITILFQASRKGLYYDYCKNAIIIASASQKIIESVWQKKNQCSRVIDRQYTSIILYFQNTSYSTSL